MSEIYIVQELKDIKAEGCNALCVYLGNFGSEIFEKLLVKHFDGPKMFVAEAEETVSDLLDRCGNACCGILNASYNLKLCNIYVCIPEYLVETAEKCADMIHDFLPVTRVVDVLKNLKIISFSPRLLNFFKSFYRCMEGKDFKTIQ